MPADSSSPTQRTYPKRRKRARLKTAFRQVRERVVLYRNLFVVALAACAVLAFLYARSGSAARPEAVLLGVGAAGVTVTAEVASSEPLAANATEAEPETAPADAAAPGEPAGAGEA